MEFIIIYVLHSTKFLRCVTIAAFVDESWTAKYFYRFTYRTNSALIFFGSTLKRIFKMALHCYFKATNMKLGVSSLK